MTIYSEAELAGLLNSRESHLVERKRSAADRSGIRRNICAFANDLSGTGRPGVIFIGVEDYRNPLVAEIMHHLGFAQRFGLGVLLAHEELEKNGNPKPEFDFLPTYFEVVLRAAT